jgi:hypothetical protein
MALTAAMIAPKRRFYSIRMSIMGEAVGKRIVIFPFESKNSDVKIAEKNWKKARKRKMEGAAYRDSETGKLIDGVENYDFYDLSQFSELKERISTCVSGNDQIYVLGHCAPGLSILGADETLKGGSIKAVDLARLFVLSKWLHLPQAFAGKIKIYACFSAVSAGAKKPSFAATFKTYMDIAKYANCTIIGYSAEVGNYGDEHKIAGTGRAMVRAKDAQVVI